MKINTELHRIFGLDVLRMLAIVFVMLIHGAKFVPQKYAKYYDYLIFDGVGIFFVLSGFLIGGIFIRQMEMEFSWKEIKFFWIKRWTRTLPNYYLFLLLSIIVGLVFGDVPNEVWRHFLFIQNLCTHSIAFFTHSWSLSVEEWFYILLPLIIFLLIKLNISFRKAVLIYIFFTIGMSTFGRFYTYLSIDNFDYNNFSEMRYAVFYRLDAIMYGVLGAYVYHYFPKFWNENKKIYLGISIGLFVINWVVSKFVVNDVLYRIMEFTITSFITLFSIPYLNTIQSNHIIHNKIVYRVVTIISIISYSLYLINSMVSKGLTYIFNTIMIGVEEPPIPWIIIFAIFYIAFWCISIFLSYFAYYYFEVKTTRYLRKKLIK